MRKEIVFIAALLAVLSVSVAAQADVFNLTLTDFGFYGTSRTRVFGADLTTIAGLGQISSVHITDDGTMFGGASGIFSGFDLDAVFLDEDGDLTTASDRHFATQYGFTAGSTRATTASWLQPDTNHPGPTFGSLDATNVDETTATLKIMDAVSIADKNVADGFLTLGDGGRLVASYFPDIVISQSMYLFLGEVGGQCGEFVNASVEISNTPVPEPTPLLLIGIGIIGLAGFGRRKLKS